MRKHVVGKPISGGIGNIFWRTLLGILFLYLNFAAYQLLGIEAVAVTSGFLLLAQFAPFFLHIFDRRRSCPPEQQSGPASKLEYQRPDGVVLPLGLVSQAEQESA